MIQVCAHVLLLYGQLPTVVHGVDPAPRGHGWMQRLRSVAGEASAMKHTSFQAICSVKGQLPDSPRWAPILTPVRCHERGTKTPILWIRKLILRELDRPFETAPKTTRESTSTNSRLLHTPSHVTRLRKLIELSCSKGYVRLRPIPHRPSSTNANSTQANFFLGQFCLSQVQLSPILRRPSSIQANCIFLCSLCGCVLCVCCVGVLCCVCVGWVHEGWWLEAAGVSDDSPRTPNVHTLRVTALQTPPKFHEKTPREKKKRHEKTPREEKRERKWERERKKKNAKFWGPTFGPPRPWATTSRPPPFGLNTLWALPFFLGLGLHPSGPSPLWAHTLRPPPHAHTTQHTHTTHSHNTPTHHRKVA